MSRPANPAAACVGALASLTIVPYVLGWFGLALMPALVAVLAGAAGLAAGRAFAPAISLPAPVHDDPLDAAPLWAWAAVVAGVGGWLLWLSWPQLLPPGGASDLTHHLQLVDVLARTRHLIDGDVMGSALGEMAHYTPGLHLAIVTVGALAQVDAWRAAHPLVIATVALKAGFLFLIAHRLLAGSRTRVPLALSAVAFVLFMPRAYSLGGFLQSGYLAQVAAELFVVAGWWALAEWRASPRRTWMALLGACGAAAFLVWPIWIGPLILATAVVVLWLADLPIAERVRALALGAGPLAFVAGLHLSRHAAYLRMAGTSGAVPAFLPDAEWWTLVALAAFGLLTWGREPRARVTVVFAAALALQAAALVALARARGAETAYMAVKVTYLAAYPLAVLAAAGLARVVARLPRRLERAGGWLSMAVIVVAAARLAGGFTVAPPVAAPDLYAAGSWARAALPPECVDYLVKDRDTAYWLHLAVMGQARASARTAALDRYSSNEAVGRWVDGSSRPYAVADASLVPAEVRTATSDMYRVGGAVVIARPMRTGDAACAVGAVGPKSR